MTRRTYTTVLTALIIVTIGAAAWAQHEHSPDRANDEAKSGADRCQMMADHMQQMQAMMMKMDQQLDAKVQTMNQASGDAKVTAMAGVINELVSQRKQMHDRMAQMRQKMMGHMAQHMQMGMSDQQKNAMKDCPMMKAMMRDGDNAGEHVENADRAESQKAPKHDHQH